MNSLSDGGPYALQNRARLRGRFDFRPAGCLPSHAQRSCAWNHERRGLPRLRRRPEMNITVDPNRHTCFSAYPHGPLLAAAAPSRARDALSWGPFRFIPPGFVMARFIARAVVRAIAGTIARAAAPAVAGSVAGYPARVLADQAPASPPGLLRLDTRMSVLMPRGIRATATRRFPTRFPDPVSRDALTNRRAAAIARTRGTR